jgi:cytochrome c553
METLFTQMTRNISSGMKSIIILGSLAIFTLPLCADVERGKQLYAQVCFLCHGSELEGGKGPALTDAYWRHGSSEQEILKILNEGVKGTEMVGYGAIFPQSDIQSLLSFLLSKQKGVRELKREEYAKVHFEGQELTPGLFAGREASNATPIPENVFWVDGSFGGAVRYHGKFYAWDDAQYLFDLNSPGRTVVYLNGELITKTGDGYPKAERFQNALALKKGAYELEILHESKRKHGNRIAGGYGIKGKPLIQFHGASLKGSSPKFVLADPMRAIVARKAIRGISQRALLCLFPNKVIVAFSPETGLVEKAWQAASIDQTPSLPDRSFSPSKIEGVEIVNPPAAPALGDKAEFRGYRLDRQNVIIRFAENGQERTLTISPEGSDSYTISQ